MVREKTNIGVKVEEVAAEGYAARVASKAAQEGSSIKDGVTSFSDTTRPASRGGPMRFVVGAVATAIAISALMPSLKFQGDAMDFANQPSAIQLMDGKTSVAGAYFSDRVVVANKEQRAQHEQMVAQNAVINAQITSAGKLDQAVYKQETQPGGVHASLSGLTGPLTATQLKALNEIATNVGAEQMASSGMVEHINAGDYMGAVEASFKLADAEEAGQAFRASVLDALPAQGKAYLESGMAALQASKDTQQKITEYTADHDMKKPEHFKELGTLLSHQHLHTSKAMRDLDKAAGSIKDFVRTQAQSLSDHPASADSHVSMASAQDFLDIQQSINVYRAMHEHTSTSIKVAAKDSWSGMLAQDALSVHENLDAMMGANASGYGSGTFAKRLVSSVQEMQENHSAAVSDGATPIFKAEQLEAVKNMAQRDLQMLRESRATIRG